MNLAAVLSALQQLEPAERAQTAGHLLEQLAAATVAAKHIRHTAVAELRARGASHADIARHLGISRGRAQQLSTGQ